MDLIDKLIEEIQHDAEIRQTRFSNKSLAIISDICNRYGYGAVRLYLLSKREDESRVLLKVLNKIEDKEISKELGAFVLKKLNAIKSVREI
ncbi:MAG: hypothetical protein K6T73_08815 [Candidatus Bathyarchaeota archaeon]|jgi:predicted regulator of amino acid metabolism with ACT domain|nr:hypothetical protein [Candidatus Bathyarchaeota archaeon]